MMQNYKVWLNDSLLPTTLCLPQPALTPFLETLRQPAPSSPSKSQPQRHTQKESLNTVVVNTYKLKLLLQ